jgi:hypothetical protein
MTTPDRDESFAPEEALEVFDLDAEGRGENPVLGWAKAIVLGIGDTAKDMLAEGRRGAREAREEGWERFDEKTKRRRG